METLHVALGARTYPVYIGAGLLAREALYAPHLPRGRVAVVSDTNVAPRYLEQVAGALARAGAHAVVPVVVDAGEGAKDWRTLDRVFDALLEGRVGRDGLIVALGGGVIGDLAGFAAAVYQRGVPFLQVPTTLLAQVDSAVGGKTAINHARGKNMIGAFHQPRAVIADVGTLATLPERELRAGVGEVLKYGFALDAGFAAWLEARLERLLARDGDILVQAVHRCCELKAAVVAADEREETGLRTVLNFGHTFGHAIEAVTGYGAWLHGEAVAAGMVMAARLSASEGLLSPAEAERIERLVARAGLPAKGPKVEPQRLIAAMQVDKKASAEALRFVLLEALGRAVVRDGIAEAHIRAAIEGCQAA